MFSIVIGALQIHWMMSMINVVPFSRMSVQDRAYPRLLAVISLVTLPNTPSGQILTRIWQYINHLLSYLLT